MFAEIVTQRDREPGTENQASPTAEAKEAPEELEQSTTQEEPGEEILTEENKPEAEGDEKPETEEASEETDLSQSEDKALNEALAGLNDDAKTHLLEMVKGVQAGEISLGELKRNWKLGRKENEELVQLREKVQQLESAPPVAARDVPPSVAKLKTVEEVGQRAELCQQSIDAIEDFLETNPSGGEIGGQGFTREQLVERKRAFRDELKVLPRQAQTIQQAAQVRELQAANRAQARKDYPWLADAEHPETKAVGEKLKSFPFLNQTANPEYWAAVVVRGEKAMTEERTRRMAGKLGAAARPAAKTGTVPAGKPHAAAAVPARSSNGSAPVGDLLKAVKDKSSFAELLESTGR